MCLTSIIVRFSIIISAIAYLIANNRKAFDFILAGENTQQGLGV